MWVNVEVINEKGNKDKKYYHILSKYFPFNELSEAHYKTQKELELRKKGTKPIQNTSGVSG